MDRDLLKKARLVEEDVDLPGVGTVRVRAMSRAEAMRIKDKSMSVAKMEQIILSTAMLDPVMSVDDVREWQEASGAGEIELVVAAVTRMSGLERNAGKSDLPADGE